MSEGRFPDSFDTDDIQESNVEHGGMGRLSANTILKANENHYFRHPDLALANQNTNAMLIEEGLKIRGGNNYGILNFENKDEENFVDPQKLKEKLYKSNRTAQKQQEDYKAQILHIETISMMTKYQLVFIKMEASLIKLGNIIRNRENGNVASAFSTIQTASHSSRLLKQYKTTLIFQRLKFNVETLVKSLNKLKRKNLAKAFYVVQTKQKLYRAEKKFREDKEKLTTTYTDSLNNKDKEITNLNRKLAELNNIVATTKNRESEYVTKLKQKDKLINQLENEKSDLNKQRRMTPVDGYDDRHLEQRLRDLQQENDELRDKLSNTEGNVGNFIKEISELLDTHELSTNVGSEENNSFFASNNQDFGVYDLNEELESLSKTKERSSLPGNLSGKASIKDKDTMKYTGQQADSKAQTNRTGGSSSNTGRYANNKGYN